jgi:regulatory GntR family protein
VIEFHLDGRSGVPAYLQLVQQVRQAIRLGIVRPGDQLPTVKEVVTRLTITRTRFYTLTGSSTSKAWSRAGEAWARLSPPIVFRRRLMI